uniref:Uncharacterized protein n=1 Tax=Rhizophora mucronata TaxID=61149 RepID=A0A2P2JW62_RHIMU
MANLNDGGVILAIEATSRPFTKGTPFSIVSHILFVHFSRLHDVFDP